jgi:hypothetical protein
MLWDFENEADSHAQRIWSESAEIQETGMLEMRCKGESVDPSHRQGLEQQQSRQSPDFMCSMSYNSPSSERRDNPQEAVGTMSGLSSDVFQGSRSANMQPEMRMGDAQSMPYPLTTERIPHRSHRLKALGNACVPAQALPFFAAIAAVG